MPEPTPNEEQFNIIIEENKKILQEIVDYLRKHPAEKFFSFSIQNLERLIQDPFDLPTILDTLSFTPRKTNIDFDRHFPFKYIKGVALASNEGFYVSQLREKYKELITKVPISLDFKLAMSNVIRRWAQDIREWAEGLKETPTDAENISKNFNDFLDKKGWGGVARILVLGRTGPYNNPNDELDKYSKVPEEINFGRRLWLEGRREGERNGPFLQAFINSIPMKTR